MHKSPMILFVFQHITIALMSTTMCQCLALWFFSCWAVATIRQIILPGCLLYSPLRSLFPPPPTTKVLMTLQHEILLPVCFGSVWNIRVMQVFEGIGNILGVKFHQLLFFLGSSPSKFFLLNLTQQMQKELWVSNYFLSLSSYV